MWKLLTHVSTIFLFSQNNWRKCHPSVSIFNCLNFFISADHISSFSRDHKKNVSLLYKSDPYNYFNFEWLVMEINWKWISMLTFSTFPFFRPELRISYGLMKTLLSKFDNCPHVWTGFQLVHFICHQSCNLFNSLFRMYRILFLCCGSDQKIGEEMKTVLVYTFGHLALFFCLLWITKHI